MQGIWTDKLVARLIAQPISTAFRIRSATARAAFIACEIDQAIRSHRQVPTETELTERETLVERGPKGKPGPPSQTNSIKSATCGHQRLSAVQPLSGPRRARSVQFGTRWSMERTSTDRR